MKNHEDLDDSSSSADQTETGSTDGYEKIFCSASQNMNRLQTPPP
jgi:hypothetical protein